MKIINMSIDVTKLDKNRFYKGKKGTYANLTIMLNDEPDQYGNHGMITESITKEERESGKKGTILGNGKVVWEDQQPSQQSAPPADDFEEQVPF